MPEGQTMKQSYDQKAESAMQNLFIKGSLTDDISWFCPGWRIFTSVALSLGSFVHFSILDEKDIPVSQQNMKNKFAREAKGELERSSWLGF